MRAEFTEEFAKAKAQGPVAVMALQEASAKVEAGNPDYYILLANYWFARSQSVVISTKPAEGGELVVTEPGSGKAVGSFSREGVIDPELARKAPALLAEAQRRFPARIDIALGLLVILAGEDRSADTVQAVGDLFSHYESTPGGFVNKTGRPLTASEAGASVATGAWDGALAFYQKGTPESRKAAKTILEAGARVFPKDARFPNLLAAFAQEAGDQKEALALLQQANRADPNDFLVMMNLAGQYLAVGDKAAARRVAERIAKDGPEDYRTAALKIVEASSAPEPAKR